MLIITADDWGKNTVATNNTLLTFKNGSITTVSSMVFMKDSERASELALENGIEAGLHLNFSMPFDGGTCSEKLLNFQLRLASFLEKNRFAQMVYNPFLTKEFEYVFKAQYDEYMRLYGMEPVHINGHRHKHLCSNVLFDDLLPRGSKVRRTFTFNYGEKNAFNLMYRRLIDWIVENKYTCTNSFFSLMPIDKKDRLKKIMDRSIKSAVELMVHPEKTKEMDWLMSVDYSEIVSHIKKGTYGLLKQ